MKAPSANKLILSSLLALSAGSLYPYYQSVNSRSLVGDFIIGAILWGAIKSLQLRPSIVADGSSQYLIILAALAVDAAIVRHCWQSMVLSDLLMGGASLLAPMLSMRVARRIGVVRMPPMIIQSQSTNLNLAEHPQNNARTVFQSQNNSVAEHLRSIPSDSQFVSQLIPKVASLFIAGLSGSGKDFVGSILCEYLQSQFGAKIFFLDPKNDSDEHLWDSADYQYRFTGVPMEPELYLDHLKKGIKQYYQRLGENGSGQYTILVINELATSATKVDNSGDKKWLSATLQPMLSGLDSAGGAVVVLTQTLIMPTGFNSGTISQFQKLIICRDEHIENLSTQSKTVLMAGVDLSGARSACEDSPIDRAIYSSALRKWLSLPKMRQGQSYYDRDTRRWIGTPPESGTRDKNSENDADLGVLPEIWRSGGNHENSHDSGIATPLASGERDYDLEDAILEFFQSVDGARNLNQIATSRRVRSAGGNAPKVRDCLSRLSEDGLLLSVSDTWSLFDLN
jgi:hypothetical protein